MRSVLAFAVLLGLPLTCWVSDGLGYADDQKPASQERKEHWETVLKTRIFSFDPSRCDLMYSISNYKGDGQVHLIYDPKKTGKYELKFMNGDKQILEINGHRNSGFVANGDELFFAQYSTGTDGCTVVAYDLSTGRQRWKTKLKGVQAGVHFAYSNKVIISLETEVVTVMGHESKGDYIEVVDRKNGETLANRIYP